MKDMQIMLGDVPGALALVGDTLGNAGINVEGGCALKVEGGFLIHILVEDAEGARSALKDAGLDVEGEMDAIVQYISGDDRPGTLGRNAHKLAHAGVDVAAMYLATGSRMVFVTDDNVKARAALKLQRIEG